MQPSLDLRTLTVLTLLGSALATPPALARMESGAPNQQVTLAWQQGLHGSIRGVSGCGDVPPSGGLARRATLIESLRRADPELLLVEAGAFFADNDTIERPVDLAIWEEMRRLRYDAVGLGGNDLLQWELLEPLLADSALPIVCTNVEIFREARWQSLAPRSRLLSANGVRVGVLSAVEPDSEGWRLTARLLRANPHVAGSTFQSAGPRMRFLPVLEACRREARRICGDVDVVVLLACATPVLVRDVAREIPEIDLILGGSDLSPKGRPPWLEADRPSHLMGSTFVHCARGRGVGVDVTRVTVSPDGGIIDIRGAPLPLDGTVAEDPIVNEMVERLVREQNQRGQDRQRALGWGER